MYIIYSKITKVNESWVEIQKDKFCQKLANSEDE